MINKDIINYLELLYCLVNKELKIRYNYSFLGYIWALANPIAFAMIYYFAFKIILRIEMENYSLFLLCGLFPWVFFANSINRATISYKADTTLVKRIKIDLSAIPLSTVLQEGIHFCFSLPILVFLVFLLTQNIFFSWLYQIPILCILQLLFLYSFTQILSLSNVFFRDTEYLTGIFVSLSFFLTPIVYPINMVPEKYSIIFDLNPFAMMISNWRSVLLEGNMDIHRLLFFFCITFLFFLISQSLLKRYKFNMSELL